MKQKRLQMFNYVEQWHKTKLPKNRFARMYNISYPSFKYWCNQYDLDHSSTKSNIPMDNTVLPTDNTVDFTEIHTHLSNSDSTDQIQIELTFPTGIQIRIYK